MPATGWPDHHRTGTTSKFHCKPRGSQTVLQKALQTDTAALLEAIGRLTPEARQAILVTLGVTSEVVQ